MAAGGGQGRIKRLLTCWFAEFNLLASFLMRGSEVVTQSDEVEGRSSTNVQKGGRSVSSVASGLRKFISTHVCVDGHKSKLNGLFKKKKKKISHDTNY